MIVCNAIAPGKIITGKPGIANDPDALDYSTSRTPWPRLGAPDDVAGAALFLASELASYVTGVNLTGFFFCCKRAVGQMLQQEPVNGVRGRIINISSQHGMVACPGDFSYSVSKGAIVQMTRQIAVDHAKDGIVCNAIAPGKIITGKPGIANNPDALDYSRRRTPWPRLGTPDDVAGAAVFLASGMASYITGVNLMVDGGWMAA